MTKHNETPVMTDENPGKSPGLIDDAIGLMSLLRDQLHDLLQLADLETRQSINCVLTMMLVAIVVSILLVSSWLALIGAVLMALISIGLVPAVAMLLLTFANFLLAALGWLVIRRKARTLGWPATLRVIKPRRSPEGEGAAA